MDYLMVIKQMIADGIISQEIAAKYVPELKESEDEKTKRILHSISSKISFYLHDVFTEEEFQCFDAWSNAWLEEQGEQKPTDKVEPKFKVGDYIERKDGLGCHAKIIFVGGNVYGCEKLIYSEDESPFFEFMFKNQDEFQISSDFKQKPADKVEPKFKAGDWVIGRATNNEPRQISEITEQYYKSTYGGQYGFSFEEDIHLWTIQDAKDGDVLACESGWTCIFKKFNHNSFGGLLFDSYCFIDRTGWFCDGAKGHTLDERINGKIHPATKEQHDLLFQKMKEAGYMWDAEKKELKKIEQKPAWSEEDERFLNVAINILNSSKVYTKSPDKYEDTINWFKSLKNRVQPKQEWSEGDKNMLEWIIGYLENKMLNTSISEERIACKKAVDWLKSLRPQSQWKPSDEQMEALDIAIRCGIQLGSWEETSLKDLREQLKKLREE